MIYIVSLEKQEKELKKNFTAFFIALFTIKKIPFVIKKGKK